jgi:hypothetical protein
MIQSKFIKLAIIIVLLPIGSIALAMTPGSSKAHWEPKSVEQLTPNEVRELNTAKCLITSYRNEEETSTTNATHKPDQYDRLLLVRGEFAAKGQKDLLVLCKSSKNDTEFFRVVWGGPNQCANTLLMSKVSRYMKKRDPGEDYYGSQLDREDPTETLRSLALMDEQFKKYAQEWSSYGITKQWILENQKLPKLEHDTMWFGGHYSFAFYCNGKDWIQLYDYFTDITD